MTILTNCHHNARWSSEPCPPHCPGEHEECRIDEAVAGQTIARLLNLISRAYGDLLDGSTEYTMEQLSDDYRAITGHEIGC